MAPERVQPVKGWIIQNGSDPGQLHPEGPVKQDLLEPVYLRPAVISVSILADAAGREQTDPVVSAQGAGGHPGQFRQLLNGVFHRRPSFD